MLQEKCAFIFFLLFNQIHFCSNNSNRQFTLREGQSTDPAKLCSRNKYITKTLRHNFGYICAQLCSLQHCLSEPEPKNNLKYPWPKKEKMEFYTAENKQWHLEICWQMDGSRKHYIEGGNPDPERQLSYVLIHKWSSNIMQKNIYNSQ